MLSCYAKENFYFEKLHKFCWKHKIVLALVTLLGRQLHIIILPWSKLYHLKVSCVTIHAWLMVWASRCPTRVVYFLVLFLIWINGKIYQEWDVFSNGHHRWCSGVRRKRTLQGILPYTLPLIVIGFQFTTLLVVKLQSRGSKRNTCSYSVKDRMGGGSIKQFQVCVWCMGVSLV